VRVLVCGGREFNDHFLLNLILDLKHEDYNFTHLIHGGARGADRMSGEWAEVNKVPVQVYYADWEKYGKAAGMIRNKEMLTVGKPDLVIAFPGGTGTAHMVKIAKEAGVNVIEVGE
jgi:hypothetical protein